jgi:hypothetical protein
LGARFNWIFHFSQPPRYAKDVKIVQEKTRDLGKLGFPVPC